MKPNKAEHFVQKMVEDKRFRSSMTSFSSSVELWDFLESRGFDFDECDLVKAMAACMAEAEQNALDRLRTEEFIMELL